MKILHVTYTIKDGMREAHAVGALRATSGVEEGVCEGRAIREVFGRKRIG